MSLFDGVASNRTLRARAVLLIAGLSWLGLGLVPGAGAVPPSREAEIVSPLTPDGAVAVEGSVSVSNLPTEQNVVVTNPVESPVPVVVQTPGEDAYRFNMFCAGPEFTDPGCTVSSIPVPTGRQLVLTHIVAALFGDSGLRLIMCDAAAATPCPIASRLVLQLSAVGPSTQSIDLGPGMPIVGGSIRIQQAAIFDGGADITFYGVLR
jgi:hypothetical protein